MLGRTISLITAELRNIGSRDCTFVCRSDSRQRKFRPWVIILAGMTRYMMNVELWGNLVLWYQPDLQGHQNKLVSLISMSTISNPNLWPNPTRWITLDNVTLLTGVHFTTPPPFQPSITHLCLVAALYMNQLTIVYSGQLTFEVMFIVLMKLEAPSYGRYSH